MLNIDLYLTKRCNHITIASQMGTSNVNFVKIREWSIISNKKSMCEVKVLQEFHCSLVNLVKFASSALYYERIHQILQ